MNQLKALNPYVPVELSNETFNENVAYLPDGSLQFLRKFQVLLTSSLRL